MLGELDTGVFQLAGDITNADLQEELTKIALRIKRPVHLACVYVKDRPEAFRSGLAFLDNVAALGGRAVAQVHVRELQNVIGFRVGLPYDRLPQWQAAACASVERAADGAAQCGFAGEVGG